MSAATKPTADLLEQLGLDDTIACEYKPDGDGGDPCGATADRWLICRHCQRHIALCDPHLQLLDTRPASHTTRRWLIFRTVWVHCACCSDCGRFVPAQDWRRLWLTVPIGRP